MVKGVTSRPRGWGFKSLQGKVYVFMTVYVDLMNHILYF